MADKIFIEELRVRTRLGASAAERRRPQTVAVSIEIPGSLRRAARTDRLEDTVDYRAVSRLIDKVARKQPRRLAEKLASDIGLAIVRNFRVKRVKVLLKKFILKQTRSAGVQVTTLRS